MKKLFLLFLLIPFFVSSQCATTTTWNGSTWSNGAPTSTKNVIINGNYDTGNSGSINCCSITINPNSNLIVNIGDHCNVSGNNIIVDPTATFRVKANSKLIFTSNTTCTGNVTIERRTKPMKQFDYTYWSSPVNSTIGNSLLPTKWEPNWTFTFNTTNYVDVETTYMGTLWSNTPDGQDDNQDVWIHTNLTDTMIPGKGYASMITSITGPFAPTNGTTEIVSFTGTLNTGNITIPLLLSGNPSSNLDDFNLVGNPYPSAISSDQFIDGNINNISGTLYFWTHTDTMSSSYSGLALYNFSTSDYAKYTKTGGIGTSGTGVGSLTGSEIPNNAIGSCQGFLVEAENTNNLVFSPSLMSVVYDNTTSISFFKNTQSSKNKKKNNLWLNMTDGGLFSQQLIGYNNSSNLDYNKGWDSRILDTRIALKFYSIENDIKYDIQARGEFNDDDLVKLGYFSAIDGTFTINIDKKEGKMINQDVYLYDKSFDIWHDLSEPYTFSTIAGRFDNRFFIKYKNPDEDNEVHNYDEHESDKISFNAKVEVYDMFNRHLQTIEGNNLDSLPSGQILILKIYQNNEVITKKYLK